MTARTQSSTAPMTRPEPPRDDASSSATDTVVTHPDWCDPARCAATLAAAMGEAHRSTPVRVTAVSGLGDLTVTASLYQVHARWLTSVLVALDISGRDEHWQPATLAATVTVEQAGNLARVLADLAADGAAWQTRQADGYLPAVREQSAVRGEVAP